MFLVSFVEVCKCSTNMADLLKCNFKLELFTESERKDCKDSGSDLYKAELAKAKFLHTCIIQILRFRGLTHMHYHSLPHYNFVLLLGTGEQLKLGLATAKAGWSALQKIEKMRHLYKEANSIWCNLPFGQWEVVRHVFIMLAEHNFTYVSEQCLKLLHSIFESWGSSLLNELGFREIRARAKQSSSGRIAPVTAWKSLADSPVMADFGRRH